MSAEFDECVGVVTKQVEIAGSCNACHRHPRTDKDAHPDVIEISLGSGNTVGVRVCVDCAEVLLEKLKREHSRMQFPAGVNGCYASHLKQADECPWKTGERCPHPRCLNDH